jgi:hypothetical protein
MIDLRPRSERQHAETERYPRREQDAFMASVDQIFKHVVGPSPFNSKHDPVLLQLLEGQT